MNDLNAELRRMRDEVAKLPPRPRYFIARHDVPYGKVYRMWDTRGYMHAYVNRGELHDLVLTHVKGGTEVHGLGVVSPGFFGIPVFME